MIYSIFFSRQGKNSASQISAVDVILDLMSCISHVLHVPYVCDIQSFQHAVICGVITMHAEAIQIVKDKRRLYPEMSKLHSVHLKLSCSTSFSVAHSIILSQDEEWERSFDAGHWKKLWREGKTDKRSEWKREGEYWEMCNLYFANKSFNPYTVHLHDACSLHLLLLFARK